MPHFIGNLKVALFHYIPSISQFHSFNIPFFGVIDIRDVVSSLSLYIWKVEKSSYNNPEIAIEKKKGGL